MILWFSWPGEQIVEAVESLHGDRMPRRDTSTLGSSPPLYPLSCGPKHSVGDPFVLRFWQPPDSTSLK